jgi:hypothetical protein
MLRIGIGLGVIAVAVVCFFGWLKKHDAQIYQRAKVEFAQALQEDEAKKVRMAIEAEDAVKPTPDDPKALAELCNSDQDCRDRSKP